jgi:hypothetical protein
VRTIEAKSRRQAVAIAMSESGQSRPGPKGAASAEEVFFRQRGN